MAKQFFDFKKICYTNQPFFRTIKSLAKDQPKSSLLISGKRAVDTFVVVIPHLDFDEQFANLQGLRKNIEKRKLDLKIDQLKDSWEFYKDWNENKVKLQENLNKIKIKMTELFREEKSEDQQKQIENLTRHRDLLNIELQQIRENVWDMEDNVVGELLKLPNRLHPATPEKEEDLFVFYEENINQVSNHLEIGVKLENLEYYNEFICFLKNEAALFELAVPDFFINQLAGKGFIQFSNPDFTRSVLSEGVGLAPKDISELFLLENTEGHNDPLHLCGGASIFPFCGFHAKHVVAKQSLPIRYIASGRQYSPASSSLPGLYSVHQSTSVHIWSATTWNDEEVYLEFQSCVQNIQEIFNALGLKYKIVKQPPHVFKSWESLRVSFQVFSPFNKVFVEVGHVGLIDDFISKRLRMCYTDKEGELFLKVVSGTVVNVQTLLALCLERSSNKFFTPVMIRQNLIR